MEQRPAGTFNQAPKDEIRRLIEQSEFHRHVTERFLRAMGLRAGMKVLVVGCGAGDDAFLAADIVGATGRVTGIDMVEEKIAVCRERAGDLSLDNIDFETSTIEAFGCRAFDAAFGRYILMHCSDPVAVVRATADLVAAAGTIGFYEVDLLSDCKSAPPAPAFDAAMARMVQAPRAYLPSPEAPKRLLGIFTEAGLPAPNLLCERPTAGRDPMPMCRWAAGFAGKAMAYNDPDAPPLDLDSFAQDLCSDILAAGSQIAIYDQWFAWSRKVASDRTLTTERARA